MHFAWGPASELIKLSFMDNASRVALDAGMLGGRMKQICICYRESAKINPRKCPTKHCST